MKVGFSEQQQELRGRFGAWLEGEEPPAEPAGPRERRDWQRRLYDHGWLGFGWPEAWGGRGGTALDHIVVTQELARRGFPQPVGLIGLEIVGPTLLAYGTGAQLRRHVGPLLRGDELWCQGFSEPGAGSDLASLRTRGVAEDGVLTVNGQKVWTSFGAEADWCALLVRTDPDVAKHAGISYMLMDMSTEGVTARPIEQMTGEREFSELFLDDVKIPVANVLGEWNRGWYVAMNTLDAERGPFSLRRHAELRLLIDRLWAQNADELPDVGVDLGRGALEILMDVLDAQNHRVLHRLVRDQSSPESSVEKLFLTEVERAFGSLALERGMPTRTWTRSGDDGEWLGHYLFSRAASIYGGTSQIQAQVVARRLLGLPKGA